MTGLRWEFGAADYALLAACALLLAGCQAVEVTPSGMGPTAFNQISVVNELPLDGALYGHNMVVSGCMAYVTMQNNRALSKLAVANVCGSGTSYSAAPALVGEVAGSYPVMNGIVANANYLYVTYGWANNAFEVWNVGGGTTLPAAMGCTPLFNGYGYTACGTGGSGYGSLYGENPYVVGNYAYVGENSDDPGQAVQVVNVSSASAPVKANPVPLGMTAGAGLAGIWAAGSGSVLYVGTIHAQAAETQPVTIAAYDLGVDAVSPPQLGVLNVPAGYAVQAMSVAGTTVVATLYDVSKPASSGWEVLVASFANPAAPTYATVAATPGCGFQSQNFVALQGSYAFMGCGMGTGIEVVNISSVAAPVVLGEIGTALTGVGFISPQARYLYVLDMKGNLDTVDTGTVFE